MTYLNNLVKKIINYLLIFTKSIINIIIINSIIFSQRRRRKKIIFFYHPKNYLTFIHNFYIEDLLESLGNNFTIIYGHQVNQYNRKNYYFIKEKYVKYIFNIYFFISNNICDFFPHNTQSIYIHHNIYDDPWVSKENEKIMLSRILKYKNIFLSSQQSVLMVKKMFNNHNVNKYPNLKEIGYPRLDYLIDKFEDKLNENKKDSIIIAPTASNGFSELSIFNHLEYIIKSLLDKTEYKVILRPHPRDKNNLIIKNLIKKFEINKDFQHDNSENYIHTYSRSLLLITDISGTAYTYSFLTNSPCIFVSLNEQKIKDYKYNKLNFFSDREKIGKILHNLDDLIPHVQNVINGLNKYKISINILKKNFPYIKKSKDKFKKEIYQLM